MSDSSTNLTGKVEAQNYYHILKITVFNLYFCQPSNLRLQFASTKLEITQEMQSNKGVEVFCCSKFCQMLSSSEFSKSSFCK
ncbi:hypothetical protein STA3757_29710 [Stanieria sp. NIES-3757]|nr:hypothetical protein STA3757_29710 [Stanieria sp. NIES-3757]